MVVPDLLFSFAHHTQICWGWVVRKGNTLGLLEQNRF